MENIQKRLVGFLGLYLSYMKVALFGVSFYVCVASVYALLDGLLIALPILILASLLIVLLWRERRSAIDLPPASLFLEFANLLPRRYRKNIRQEISDLRLEYYEAIGESDVWRARALVINYYIGLVWSIAILVFDKSKEVVKDDS